MRSSSGSPSSFALRQRPRGTRPSASNCPSSLPRSSASTSGRLPWWVMLWITVVSMKSEIEARRVGLQGQLDHVEHQPRSSGRTRAGRRCPRAAWPSTFGLGWCSQASALCSRCSSSRTDVKYWSIRCWSAVREGAVEPLRLVADEVEHAAALPQRLDVGGDLVGLALHEELLEQLLGAASRRDRGAAAGEAERLVPLAAHGQDERGIAGAGCRPARPRTGRARSSCGSRPRSGCGVPVRKHFSAACAAGDAGVADAGEDGQVVAVGREAAQVRASAS